MANDIFDIVDLDQLELACGSQHIDLKVMLDDIDMKFAYRTAKLLHKAVLDELLRNDFDHNDLIVKVGHTRKEDGSLENVIFVYIRIGSKWHRYDLHMSELIKRFLAETAEWEDTIFDWYDFIKRITFEITCIGHPCIILDEDEDEAVRLSNIRDSQSS